jgi:hypothetical protein
MKGMKGMKGIKALVFVISCVAMNVVVAQMPAQKDKHVGDCVQKEGVERARCERHTKMAEKCGPLKGDAHFACDREFLIANALDCGKLAGKSAESCNAETKAFKTCETNQGREFMKCVRTTTGESPMGH